MEQQEIQHFIEAALLAAGRPLNIDQLQGLFDGRSTPEKAEIRKAIDSLNEDYSSRGIEILEVASGFRMQVKAAMADRLQKLWEERPPRYSRALFETLALVAYRQPITRGEIEEIRGVSVSSNIIRTLMEREWVRVVGHRDVPGRPAMFGTTKSFLDYFGLKKLDDLPELADLSDWESLRVQLDLPDVDEDATGNEPASAPAAESDEEVPTAEVPVLHPEADEPEADPSKDAASVAALADGEAAVAAEDSDADLPELVPLADDADEADEADESDEDRRRADGDFDEELVVSEWPDPAESGHG